MKITNIIRVILFLVFMYLLQSCAIYSLHPLYSQSDIIFNDDLLGTWQGQDDKDLFIIFEEHGYMGYKTIYCEDADTLIFECHLTSMGNYHFVDLYPYEGGAFPNNVDGIITDNLMKNFIPAHSFMRIDFGQKGISLIDFDNERLKELFLKNRIRLDHEVIEDDIIVITAATKDLRKFVGKYASDEKVFRDTTRFEKITVLPDTIK